MYSKDPKTFYQQERQNIPRPDKKNNIVLQYGKTNNNTWPSNKN